MNHTFHNDSSYLISDHKLAQFYSLLEQKKELTLFLGDCINRHSFQFRLLVDLYIFLTTEKMDLLVDHYKTLERPVNTYLLDMLCGQEAILKFKRMNRTNDELSFIVSIFITKKVLILIQEAINLQRLSIRDLSLVELLNLSYNLKDSSDQNQANKLYGKVIYMLKSTKTFSINLNTIIEDSLYDSKNLYYYLEKEHK